MSRILLALAAGIILVCGVGCALIVDGTKQTVTINTFPPGAQVDVNGKREVSPATFELKRNTVYNVKITKDGYRTENIVTNRKLNPWIIGNILYIPAVIIDFIDGAAWEIKPGDLAITLTEGKPEEQSAASYAPTADK